MFIKQFALYSLLFALCACGGTKQWNPEYGNGPVTGTPVPITVGLPDAHNTPGVHNVAVLLPTSGVHSDIGGGVANAIQMALVQRPAIDTNVSFYDLSGERAARLATIQSVLAENPDIIIGPLFAEDAKIIRNIKPADMPVLSFTSDTESIGGGVMTMALMPANSVEESIRQITRDGGTRIVVLAPKTISGELMAGAAQYAANAHSLTTVGIFYYDENNTDSIKSAASNAAMYPARSAANNRAREILADILANETLTAAQKSSMRAQLEKLAKAETIGAVPYDAILLLGGASDSKTAVSFIRYFEVSNRMAPIYGTALWDGAHETMSDFMMTGAKYAVLAPGAETFRTMYEQVTGKLPSRMDGFGYDAINLAIGMLRSDVPAGQYLLNPNGYNGTDGIFRLRPSGASERVLQVLELRGNEPPRVVHSAPENFIAPLYYVNPANISRAGAMPLRGPGINPIDYITIPTYLKNKYRGQTFGANTVTSDQLPTQNTEIEIIPEDDADIIENPEFTPITPDTVDRQIIDEVVIYE